MRVRDMPRELWGGAIKLVVNRSMAAYDWLKAHPKLMFWKRRGRRQAKPAPQ